MAKYIFVGGGVMSSVGKGVTTASIGKVLKSKGYSVTAMKIDPYINVDAGTMNPVEHGETFVTNDGTECDQDIGNYERFLDIDLSRDNYMTTGSVYLSVIKKERNLEFQGKCVEVVPDIPNEVISRIKKAEKLSNADFVLIEIGGTVGEYQNMLFLETARIMKLQEPENTLFVLVSFLPIPSVVGEMKTKPTQTAARMLNEAGIQPDFIIGRSTRPLDKPRKKKISIFCNISEKDVLSSPDVSSIYEIPVNFDEQGFGDRILEKFNMQKKEADFAEWRDLLNIINTVENTIKIGIIGKYFETGEFNLLDSYISVIEAIKHASWHHNVKPEIIWLSASKYEENKENLKELDDLDAIIIPGGFGTRGTEGKINAIEYARKNNIPFLGLCLGMQLAVIEYARNVCGITNATSREFEDNPQNPIIDVMEEQKDLLENHDYGGTMRLGAWDCTLNKDTKIYSLYNKEDISERHRHRYEVNNSYRKQLEENGLIFSGINKEKDLVEIIELKDHPFFAACQFHPELKSRPLSPHPLFKGLIEGAINKKAA
jgi:CTP synthase